METLDINGRILEYEVSGEGTPLVFLHGLGGSMKQIRSTLDPMEGVRLINLNQQGHGGSGADWDHMGFDSLCDDVMRLLDHLGLQRVAFAGISMGAGVAVNAALRYPKRVDRLVLIRNAWTDGPMSAALATAYSDLADCLENGGFESFRITRGWKTVDCGSDYTRNAFTIPFSEEYNITGCEKYRVMPKDRPLKDGRLLESLRIPVWILACRDDLCHPFAYGEWYHRHIPESRFIEIPSKDADPALHRQRINEVLREALFLPGL